LSNLLQLSPSTKQILKVNRLEDLLPLGWAKGAKTALNVASRVRIESLGLDLCAGVVAGLLLDGRDKLLLEAHHGLVNPLLALCVELAAAVAEGFAVLVAVVLGIALAAALVLVLEAVGVEGTGAGRSSAVARGTREKDILGRSDVLWDLDGAGSNEAGGGEKSGEDREELPDADEAEDGWIRGGRRSRSLRIDGDQ